ncbi:MAG: hypothetical protein ABW034_05915 [Steroidobacteraceae bacterium]
MSRRCQIAVLLATGIVMSAMTGCSREQQSDAQPSSTVDQAQLKDPDPHWVIRQNPPAKVALVYVHGVTGDMIGTWTADNGKTFFDLVNENPATKGKADAFVFGFPSYLFKAGSFDIREAANRLHLRLASQGVLNYPAIVFVAHSMGGLVVLRELITNRDTLLDKVPVVVLYATPMEGSVLAEIGKRFSPNSAFAQMTEADGNALLQSLNDDWRSIPDDKRPHVRCAYEKTPVGPLKIVPWSSATRFCEGATPAIEASHVSIVKPDRPGADAILVLISALNDYVLNETLEAKLETPDFTNEGDSAVFVLHNVLGKQTARLLNTGGTPLSFTLAQISDPTTLFLWPDDTPQVIKPHDKVQLGVALSRGATASEYQFTLKTPVAPDKRVIIRVPELQAAKGQQVELATKVASDVQAALNDPQQQQRFLNAPADGTDAPEALVEIAHGTIAKEAPNLPANAQWVLTADLLSASNWPGLAARALRNAEKASPATARNPGVQHLASIVAAQSGDAKIFATAATAAASPEALSNWKVVQPLTQPANANVASSLATQMEKIPAFKAFGLSLEGDLQQSKGNIAAAHAAYTEAAKIRATPSVSMRLQQVQSTTLTPKNTRALQDTTGADTTSKATQEFRNDAALRPRRAAEEAAHP